ncbi:hypothetical protein LWC33_07650 [Pseudonocardia sp. RS11V-5]|uniref:hypothetical protein n=1 Tax=Pseudonocardia terrae TaxID=2905831 RepID=UPI001E3CE2EA|nr:hypothetical protein [Pseudonocardia terrae]MCE3551325.1 hypothetical protein [Pseudonocardia terrae]
METGSLAELLSAFASIVALAAAVVAARAAVRTNQQQSVQLSHLEIGEAERRQASRAAQASQVTAWVELAVDNGTPQVNFANSSGLPVYGVTVATAAGTRTFRTTYSVLAPRESASRLRRMEDVLPAGIAWSDLLDAGDLRAALVFRDAKGGWWLRAYDGGLEPFGSEAKAQAALSGAA